MKRVASGAAVCGVEDAAGAAEPHLCRRCRFPSVLGFRLMYPAPATTTHSHTLTHAHIHSHTHTFTHTNTHTHRSAWRTCMRLSPLARCGIPPAMVAGQRRSRPLAYAELGGQSPVQMRLGYGARQMRLGPVQMWLGAKSLESIIFTRLRVDRFFSSAAASRGIHRRQAELIAASAGAAGPPREVMQ